MNNRALLDQAQFEEILKEANDNFVTGRFESAAKTYEHLAAMCMKLEYYEDMIYFYYRALISWGSTDRADKMIKVYLKLGKRAFSLGSQLSETMANNSYNMGDRMNYLELLHQNLTYYDEKEKLPEISTELINLYDSMCKENDLDYSEERKYIEKTLDLLDSSSSQYKKYQKKLAKLIENQGDHILKHAEFDPEIVAAQYYKEVADLYQTMGEIKKYEKMLEKIKRTYNE